MFEPMNFIKYLPHMGTGLLVIFVIIGVLIAITVILNKIFSQKNGDDK